MKHSIQVKLMVLFVGLTTAAFLFCWLLNSWCLEPYYMSEKQNHFKKAYQTIDKVFRTEDSSMSWELLYRFLSQFCDRNHLAMILYSSEGIPVFSSTQDIDYMWSKLQSYLLEDPTNQFEVLKKTDNYQIVKDYDQRSQSYYIEMWGFFSDRALFLMSMPLASIRDSIAISNRFFVYISVIVVFLSALAILWTTRGITKPILRLTAISKKMSSLDFTEIYHGNSHDEIQVLGDNFNHLAQTLELTISQLQSANVQLQKDIQEKIRIDQQRKEFLSNVSHELKTPIALIQGYAEGLTENILEDEQSKQNYYQVIQEEAEKMSKIVQQLLTLSHLESGKDILEYRDFDLIQLLKTMLNSLTILFQQKGIEVIFVEEESLFVYADEFKIETVLMNYLSNALNHAEGKKQIRVSIEKDFIAHQVKVFVFNTGKAIPEKDLGQIWDKFYKVDKSRTREYGGSGVGLSIVKAIIEAHRQSLGVINKDDGVEFWFSVKMKALDR
ncbi:two-component sensor histidine kinase [Clostridia bacterium]|nr:two-component sensor histidine kinase [Clostridia bacterium]